MIIDKAIAYEKRIGLKNNDTGTVDVEMSDSGITFNRVVLYHIQHTKFISASSRFLCKLLLNSQRKAHVKLPALAVPTLFGRTE